MDGCQSTNVNGSAAAVRNFAAPFVANGTAETTSVTTERFSSLSLGDDGGDFSVQPQDKPEKDPRKIARKYSLFLCFVLHVTAFCSVGFLFLEEISLA